jgi:hypothetical protein
MMLGAREARIFLFCFPSGFALPSFNGVCSVSAVLFHSARRMLMVRGKIFIHQEQIGGVECSILKSRLTVASVVFSLMLFAVSLPLVGAALLGTPEHLVWQGDVYSSGVPVTSLVLEQSVPYRIVAQGMWFYDNPNSLAADAQYFTNSSLDTWDWLNHFQNDSHSFLQIDGQDVDWGPFSNGDTGHIYSLYYTGEDASIAFAIVDWMDQNTANNVCHLHLRIYTEATVGGHIVDSSPPDAVNVLAVGVLLASLAMVPIVVHHKKT